MFEFIRIEGFHILWFKKNDNYEKGSEYFLDVESSIYYIKILLQMSLRLFIIIKHNAYFI